MKRVLVIAGSDSSGGAGIQADIKVITRLKGHALTVITAVTAQNSLGVSAIHEIPAPFIGKQLQAVFEDIIPHASKISMVYSGAAIREVVRWIRTYDLPNVVIDPVLRASTGNWLLEQKAVPLLKEELFPLARVVTPNLFEAGILSGIRVESLKDMAEAAGLIKKTGPDVVITGGHLKGSCVDLLFDGEKLEHFSDSRINTKNTHGSGCVFSSSLAVFLAEGKGVMEATKLAHEYAREAIVHGYACGQGPGPVRAARAAP